MAEIILSAKGVTKRFGGLVAVDQMDIDVEKGKLHALIGPNGSGKSTMVNCITGFYLPEEGSLTFKGQDISKMKPHERTKIGMGRTFQNIRLCENMSVRENIALGNNCHVKYSIADVVFSTKKYRGEEKQIRQDVEEVAESLGILDLLDQKVSNVPYGEQKIIEIARALMMRPELLLLDESAAGMNNVEVKKLIEILHRVLEQGITIFLIEHNMSFVSAVADKVSVMQEGKKIAEGDFATISKDPVVIESYLGKGVKRNA